MKPMEKRLTLVFLLAAFIFLFLGGLGYYFDEKNDCEKYKICTNGIFYK